jgi:hypothetical protein
MVSEGFCSFKALPGEKSMPLPFESLSHGTVAFGFFNIVSDMLLLEHYFFFAEDFCTWLADMAEKEEISIETRWPVFDIPDRSDIGDLMGAIHGVHFSGFMGELYKKYPFPAHQEDFKQNPEGHDTRQIVEDIIARYSFRRSIPVVLDGAKGEAVFAEYRFERSRFQALLSYVWQGGYPRWREGLRPASVARMKETVEAHPHGLFEKMVFP